MSQKRATVYFEADIHRVLRLKTAASEKSIPAMVNEAVQLSLAGARRVEQPCRDDANPSIEGTPNASCAGFRSPPMSTLHAANRLARGSSYA